MKNWLILMFTFVLSACSSSDKKSPPMRDVPVEARDSRLEEPRKRVLILPFIDVSSQRSQDVTTAARSAMVKSINQTKKFVIIENQDFPKDLNSFRLNDQYDLENIGKIAAGMGIAMVIEGKVLDVRARRLGDQVGLIRKVRAQMEGKVQIRVMGTRQGRELMNEIREATIETTTTKVGEYAYSDRELSEDPALIRQTIEKAVRGVVPTLVTMAKKISWEGRIALVSGDRVYLNAGRVSGIQVGDILKVNDEGSDVFDPDTGVYLGRAPGRMKGTVEIISYFGKDGSIAVVHSGSGFKEADQVEFY